MSSHIHPVSFIIHSLRDTADLVSLLEDHHFIFVRRSQKFIGSCQAGRPRADNDDFFHEVFLSGVLKLLMDTRRALSRPRSPEHMRGGSGRRIYPMGAKRYCIL